MEVTFKPKRNGKPAERWGRKVRDLRPFSQGYDCPAAEVGYLYL